MNKVRDLSIDLVECTTYTLDLRSQLSFIHLLVQAAFPSAQRVSFYDGIVWYRSGCGSGEKWAPHIDFKYYRRFLANHGEDIGTRHRFNTAPLTHTPYRTEDVDDCIKLMRSISTSSSFSEISLIHRPTRISEFVNF